MGVLADAGGLALVSKRATLVYGYQLTSTPSPCPGCVGNAPPLFWQCSESRLRRHLSRGHWRGLLLTAAQERRKADGEWVLAQRMATSALPEGRGQAGGGEDGGGGGGGSRRAGGGK
jgi:hypothetical protein